MTLTHDDPVTEPARFRPRGQDDLAPSGTASRVAANLAALRLLRLLEREDRPATPDEQAVLARWSGWGAVPQVFDDDRAEFAAARAELHQHLPEAEYAAARRTTINAHYTDAALAKVVWDHVTALGSGTGQRAPFLPSSCSPTGNRRTWTHGSTYSVSSLSAAW